MHKLKRIVFNIMFLSFIIKANECYGMETNENKGGEKTVMEGIKALPYPKIFIYGNKLFFSLAHSIINNFYELETLEMNKVYSLKKYLCWGYRLQPTFMTPYSFLDFNVNILGGIIDTAIFLYLYRSSGIKTPSKIFYSLTSFLNINLNIRIKSDFYIAINILGLMRAIFIPFLIKDDESLSNIIKNDNNLDINLLGNNNPTNINENDIVNNNQDINNNNKNENDNNSDNNLSDNNNSGDNNENNILKNLIDQEQNNRKNNINEYNNPDFNNKSFNQENNNNNQENNNEDKWEKIKKDLEKEQKDERIIQKIYEELEDDYGVSYRFKEEEVKKIIAENIENREEINRIIENMMLTEE